MPNLDELLERVAAGDDEAAAELKSLYASQAKTAAVAQRDLKLKTDSALRERYPRALRAWEKGKLRLGEDVDGDALMEALREKEEEYAEMGVPVETKATATPPVATPAGGDGADDPAEALSGAVGASSPGGQVRDLVAEYFDAIKGSTTHDQARANSLLVELNQGRQAEKIQQITESLSARPITPNTI